VSQGFGVGGNRRTWDGARVLQGNQGRKGEDPAVNHGSGERESWTISFTMTLTGVRSSSSRQTSQRLFLWTPELTVPAVYTSPVPSDMLFFDQRYPRSRILGSRKAGDFMQFSQVRRSGSGGYSEMPRWTHSQLRSARCGLSMAVRCWSLTREGRRDRPSNLWSFSNLCPLLWWFDKPRVHCPCIRTTL
jgi:hypothetical protein